MAARAIWKGHLRLSLVTIPIRVYPATNSAATISFHQLHRKCQTRIQYRKWCPHCEREVTKDEIVKGYEFERGQYVPLEEEEIARVRPESTRIIALSQFTDAEAIDPVLVDTPYYLGPDGKVAAESFAVMREALRGKAGIGTVAIHGRDRLVAIEARERGMIMFSLRHEREIRRIDAIDEVQATPEKVKTDELSLAKRVIGGFEDKVDFSKYHDTYEDALREMIEAKIKGREIISTEEVEERPKVVNLMDALRKSLDEASRAKKRPAKVPAPAKRRGAKPAGARKRASA